MVMIMSSDESLVKLKCEFFDDCVEALAKTDKIIVLDDILNVIQRGAYTATPTYYNEKEKDPTFFKDGIKTKLKNGVYYKGVKVSDLY